MQYVVLCLPTADKAMAENLYKLNISIKLDYTVCNLAHGNS